MTTAKPVAAATSAKPPRFVFPDPPEDRPEDREDKMTSFKRLTRTGNVLFLADHLGNPETTLVGGELYVSPEPTTDMTGVRYPDLFVAFDVDPAAYYASNAYVISEQGKPPDFVLEIASRSSGRTDTGPKRRDYAALLIPEYWRFDETETGRYHGARLAGDRLVNGEYEDIDIEELPDGSLQGYSAVLNLYLRWERGELAFYDPATGLPIASLHSEREARRAAEARAAAAEARIRELEEQLHQRGG